MQRLTCVAVCLLAMSVSGAGRRPAATLAPGGALTITLPADLLQQVEVKEQLTSGLTTVFIISSTADDGERVAKGAVRVDVRFELWEERYIVSLIDATGQERQFTFDSESEFGRWWAENPMTVTLPRSYGPRVDVRVKLKMLPFSSQEQSDTRRWLARTLSASRVEGSEVMPAQSADILRIIVETSIRRRPLLEREWSVRVVRQGVP